MRPRVFIQYSSFNAFSEPNVLRMKENAFNYLGESQLLTVFFFTKVLFILYNQGDWNTF